MTSKAPMPLQLQAKAIDVMDDLAAEFHLQVRSGGFWDEDHGLHTLMSKLALVHSEISEALEELRKNPDPAYVYERESDGKPEGFRYELADAMIRILDIAGRYGLSIGLDMVTKDAFNRTRPFMHGKTA